MVVVWVERIIDSACSSVQQLILIGVWYVVRNG